jgi:hypothetical protein
MCADESVLSQERVNGHEEQELFNEREERKKLVLMPY